MSRGQARGRVRGGRVWRPGAGPCLERSCLGARRRAVSEAAMSRAQDPGGSRLRPGREARLGACPAAATSRGEAPACPRRPGRGDRRPAASRAAMSRGQVPPSPAARSRVRELGIRSGQVEERGSAVSAAARSRGQAPGRVRSGHVWARRQTVSAAARPRDRAPAVSGAAMSRGQPRPAPRAATSPPARSAPRRLQTPRPRVRARPRPEQPRRGLGAWPWDGRSAEIRHKGGTDAYNFVR
jgi:hypothetical protein